VPETVIIEEDISQDEDLLEEPESSYHFSDEPSTLLQVADQQLD
jgi:hypothetical protein